MAMSVNPNRRAVLLGGVATTFATILLFVVPVLLPMQNINETLFEQTGTWWTRNPLLQLRLFGGFVGGFVAGYFARDEFNHNNWSFSVQSGLYAGLVGALLSYLLYVGINFLTATVFAGMFPPPVYVILVVPAIYALPLFPAYALEGMIAGVIGNAASIAKRSRGPGDDGNRRDAE